MSELTELERAHPIRQRPKRQTKLGSTCVTVRFAESDFERLSEIASRTERSRAAVLRLLLRHTDYELLGMLALHEKAARAAQGRTA